MAVNLATEYRDVVEDVARKTGVSADLIVDLLNLERRHQNLHGWGARPALRRDISAILDRALSASQAGKEADR
ncbi:hypothetical protein C8P66_12448 [Humitalea rosea]|uniref:Uncharacterized protein n=1 Tax=Humitalea rosea TaxID=990373 RepID=A0A2W7I2N7_9PROT|nr:hypothetical protein C8P66_12448 [Humitalea rosea]